MMKGEKENMMRKQAEDGQIFSLRFMPCNVADCQRTPAFPQVGKPFRVSGFENPHYQGRELTEKEMAGHYFKLAREKDGVSLYLCRVDGKMSKDDPFCDRRIAKGRLYGLDQKGFMLETGENCGYFFAPADLKALGEVSYIAAVGEASEEQISHYRMTGNIFDTTFKVEQVKDCQRFPAFPEAGKLFRMDRLSVPFGPDGPMDGKKLEGHHFRFVRDENDGITLYVCSNAEPGGNDPYACLKLGTGKIYGLGEPGFLFVSGRLGYFVSNFDMSGWEIFSYVPETGEATMEQIMGYPCGEGVKKPIGMENGESK